MQTLDLRDGEEGGVEGWGGGNSFLCFLFLVPRRATDSSGGTAREERGSHRANAWPKKTESKKPPKKNKGKQGLVYSFTRAAPLLGSHGLANSRYIHNKEQVG